MYYYTWSKILDQDQNNILFALYVVVMVLVGKKYHNGKSEKFLFHRSYADVSEFLIMINITIMVIYTGAMLL